MVWRRGTVVSRALHPCSDATRLFECRRPYKGARRRELRRRHGRLRVRLSSGFGARLHLLMSLEVPGVVGEADRLVILPQCHDAVIEAKAGSAAAEFSNLERSCRLVGDV